MPGNKAKIIFGLCLVLIYGVLLFRGVSPSFHENYYMSLLYMGMNDYENAMKFAKEELNRSPKDVDTHLLLVRCYLHQKDMKSAKVYLKKALGIQPAHNKARMYLKYFPSFSYEQ